MIAPVHQVSVSRDSFRSRARVYFSQRVFSGARSLLTTQIAKWERARRLCLMLSIYFAVVLLLLDEFCYNDNAVRLNLKPKFRKK